MSKDSLERLQKILAHAGVASRRKAEEMIQQGRVTVNGRIVTQLGTKVDPARDDIRVDGERLKIAPSHVYILLNKPAGVLSIMDDERGRRSLGDLVPLPARLYPVGRLDVNSEGLILLTDDGELANLLTHPRYEHEKEYRVLVSGHPAEKTLEAWQRGVISRRARTHCPGAGGSHPHGKGRDGAADRHARRAQAPDPRGGVAAGASGSRAGAGADGAAAPGHPGIGTVALPDGPRDPSAGSSETQPARSPSRRKQGRQKQAAQAAQAAPGGKRPGTKRSSQSTDPGGSAGRNRGSTRR